MVSIANKLPAAAAIRDTLGIAGPQEKRGLLAPNFCLLITGLTKPTVLSHLGDPWRCTVSGPLLLEHFHRIR